MSFWAGVGTFLGSAGGKALLGAGSTLGAAYLGSQGGSTGTAGMTNQDREWAHKVYERDMQHQLGWHDWQAVKQGTSVDDIGRNKDIWQGEQTMRRAFDVGKDYGLTPTEIAGSPVPGGTSSSGGGATLGNQAAAASANSSAMANAEADRRAMLQGKMMDNRTQLGVAALQSGVGLAGQATQRRGQDVQLTATQMQTKTAELTSKIAAQASIKSSAMISSATIAASKIAAQAANFNAATNRMNVLGSLKLQGQMTDAQVAEISAQTGLLLQDKSIKAALHSERWERLFSAMGAENVVTSALALKHDLPLESVLKGNFDKVSMKDLQAFMDEVIARSSLLGRETMGAVGVAGSVLDTILGR